jgi:sulfofructose kinase
MPGSNQSRQPRVVCIGSAALDIVLEVDAPPTHDERVPASRAMIAGGGPAATAAVTLSRLGVPVTFVGRVGDDPAGALIRAGLQHEGVATDLLVTDAEISSPISSCLVQPDGSRTLAAFGGIGSSGPQVTPAVEAACRAATWIHVDHAGWQAALELGHCGVRTNLSVDGGNPIPELDLTLVTLYAPSRQEICRWTGQADLGEALHAALNAGASMVVATDGAQGSVALVASPSGVPSLIRQAAYPAAGQSTLGAGDVYHGALLAALLGGRPLANAMDFASATAALSCRGLDGRSGIPSQGEVEELMGTGTRASAIG